MPHVSLKAIAAATGFSTATVSLALRNSPRISAETKRKIAAVAATLGYKPAPELGKLMSELRKIKETPFRSTICALKGFVLRESQYVTRIISRATKEAERLGYKVVVEPIPINPEKRKRHNESLRHRNIEGLLFLPTDLPVKLDTAYDWPNFSGVHTGFSPISPGYDRVTANWFDALRVSIRRLREKGFRRIGVVTGIHFDILMQQTPSAAIAEEYVRGNTEPVRPFFYLPDIKGVPLCLLTDEFREVLSTRTYAPCRGGPVVPLRDGIVEWYRSERPDVVVFDRVETIPQVLPLLEHEAGGEKVVVATVSRPARADVMGVFQPGERVGEMAIHVLHLKLTQNSKGCSNPANELSIKGEWREADF